MKKADIIAYILAFVVAFIVVLYSWGEVDKEKEPSGALIIQELHSGGDFNG